MSIHIILSVLCIELYSSIHIITYVFWNFWMGGIWLAARLSFSWHFVVHTLSIWACVHDFWNELMRRTFELVMNDWIRAAIWQCEIKCNLNWIWFVYIQHLWKSPCLFNLGMVYDLLCKQAHIASSCFAIASSIGWIVFVVLSIRKNIVFGAVLLCIVFSTFCTLKICMFVGCSLYYGLFWVSLYSSDIKFQAIGSTLVKKGGLSSGDVAARFAFTNGAVDVKFDTESNVFPPFCIPSLVVWFTIIFLFQIRHWFWYNLMYVDINEPCRG